MHKKRIILLAALALVLIGGGLFTLRRFFVLPGAPLASARLSDGRILQIEGVTFGTQHHIGRKSMVEPVQPWLPGGVVKFFSPPYPRSDITLDEPGLVVWVNAIDPTTGNHVDCQGIRMEFVDEHGDLFGQKSSSWSGSPGFWRAGHIFTAFPRTQPTLTLQVSCWKKTNSPVRIQIPNPCVTTPSKWIARPPPQQLQVGGLEVELASLELRTNGGPKKYWETPCKYWEPVWKLRSHGEPASGWDKPEWTAADPTGNQGQFLGLHQPMLRFSAEFYPSATNLADSILLGRLAETNVANPQTNAWRDLIITNGSAQLTVLGLFPAGTYVFTEGRLETNPAIRMGATKGGAPSGWVGQSQRVSPIKVKYWEGHYTPVPVVYIHTPALPSKERLGLRLRDEQGRYWLARPEPQGPSDGIWPFLVELPPEAKVVSGEVVLLKPIRAEFTVQTPGSPPP